MLPHSFTAGAAHGTARQAKQSSGFGIKLLLHHTIVKLKVVKGSAAYFIPAVKCDPVPEAGEAASF
jgi:hypothetical protein